MLPMILKNTKKSYNFAHTQHKIKKKDAQKHGIDLYSASLYNRF